MQLKKILAIFLAATLIFSAAILSSGAETVNDTFKVGVVAETATPISTSPMIFNQGEEVTVKISVEQNTGISFLYFDTFFNADAFEYVSHKSADLFEGMEVLRYQEKDNKFVFFVNLNKDIKTVTGEMFSITFKTKETFCGNTQITTKLHDDHPANCAKVSGAASNTHIPFEANTVDVAIHSIVKEDGVVTDPTCVDQGYTTYKCTACENDVVGNIVEALGHKEAEAVEENRVEATCTVDGQYDSVVYCSVCNEELSRTVEVIKAPGHTDGEVVVENRVEPTCTEKGSYEDVVYCTVCNEELSRVKNEIAAFGHKEGEVKVENRVEPNCVDKGTYEDVIYCTVCNEELSREMKDIAALGHKEGEVKVENRVKPTCTENGSYEDVVYCTVCDEELSRVKKEIAALGHDLKKTDAKAPTCTEIGWDEYETCQREGCKYTTYNELAALGHKDAEAVEENRKESTPTEKGNYDMVVYCSVCEAELDRKNHTIAHFLGDINGDEEVTSDDAVQLLYNTLLPEEYEVYDYITDINDDGEVNSDDAVYLLYYTLLPDEYPIPVVKGE